MSQYLNLYYKDIGGQRAGIDVFYDDNGADDTFIWSTEDSVSGYIKMTSAIEFIDNDCMSYGKADYVAKKDCLKQLVIALGSGNEDNGIDALVTSPRKIAACSLLIGTYAKRIAVFGGDFADMEAATAPYNINAIRCRSKRLNDTITNGHTYIPSYMGVVLSEIGQLHRYYVDMGLKGQPYDPAEYGVGLSHYINSLAPFDGVATVPWLGTTCNGLSTKGWATTDGRTSADVATDWNRSLFERGVQP